MSILSLDRPFRSRDRADQWPLRVAFFFEFENFKLINEIYDLDLTLGENLLKFGRCVEFLENFKALWPSGGRCICFCNVSIFFLVKSIIFTTAEVNKRKFF